MDELLGSIAFKDVSVSETNMIRLSLKSVHGKVFLDVRKWVKWPNLDHHVATKKGLMIEAKEWKGLMEQIGMFIADNQVDLAA